MSNDVIELRLPPRPEYISVLRAAVGVVAGAMSFTYDDIVQLRVAVSEAFELAIKYVARAERGSDVGQLIVCFEVGPDKLAIQIPAPAGYTAHLDYEEEKESYALLRSLMDELEFGVDGKHVIQMAKHRPAGQQQS